MKPVNREFLQALEKDLSITIDIIFALRLAVDDEAPIELLTESTKMLGDLVAHRETLKLFLEG